jgi:hypothetical protein
VERKYSSCSFSTSALNGGEWSASRPFSAEDENEQELCLIPLHPNASMACSGTALPPGKGPRYPLYRRLGGLQSRSEHRG